MKLIPTLLAIVTLALPAFADGDKPMSFYDLTADTLDGAPKKLADYKGKNAFDFFVMQANEALSYKFTVGMVDISGGFIYNDAANAVVRPTFISITAVPCDFDVSKLAGGPNPDPCYQTGLNGNSVNWANITGALPANYCRLVKGQTYYLNLRFQDARPANQGGSPTTDSCISGNCGGIIQVL